MKKKGATADACLCEWCACSQCEQAHRSPHRHEPTEREAYLLAISGNATRAVHTGIAQPPARHSKHHGLT